MATGWDLYSTLQQQAEYTRYYRTIPPVACPYDGEPLKDGPPNQPGILYCPYGNFEWPRDYNVETMAGM